MPPLFAGGPLTKIIIKTRRSGPLAIPHLFLIFIFVFNPWTYTTRGIRIKIIIMMMTKTTTTMMLRMMMIINKLINKLTN